METPLDFAALFCVALPWVLDWVLQVGYATSPTEGSAVSQTWIPQCISNGTRHLSMSSWTQCLLHSYLMPRCPPDYKRNLCTSLICTWTSVPPPATWIPRRLTLKMNPLLTGFLICRHQIILSAMILRTQPSSDDWGSVQDPGKTPKASLPLGPQLTLNKSWNCVGIFHASEHWGNAALRSSNPCHSGKRLWWSATGHEKRLKAEAPSQGHFKNVCVQVKGFLMF